MKTFLKKSPSLKTSRPSRNSGLTLVEVLVIVGIVMLLAVLLLPTLSSPHGRASQLSCVSNLKQVGIAWLSWVHDHDATEFHFRTPVANGGTFGSKDLLRNKPWWQYAAISNELGAPKILVCPSDKKVGLPRMVAANWGALEEGGGFTSSGFRDRAVSYTIGLEATQPRFGTDWDPTSPALATDRNILFDGRVGDCSSGVGAAEFIKLKGKSGEKPRAAASWTNAIHGLRGNVLCADGSVAQTETRELNALCDRSDDNGSIHFLVPK